MTYPDIYSDKDKTKFSHVFCQILEEVTHGGPAPGCLWKSRPHVIGSVGPLSDAELGFGLVSEGDPDPFPLKLFLGRILRWPSQLSAHYLDPLFLEDFPVGPVEIDLVTEESLRLGAEPFLVLPNMDCKVGGFVVGIPAVMVNERVTAYYADTDLSPEHGLLLVVHVDDRLYGALLHAVEPPVGLVVNAYEIKKREGIDVVDGDPLADGREQGRVEDRPVGILCQAAHVLHVGIFLDGEYRLLIGKTELVLDDKGGDSHTSRAVASPDSVILQPLVIDLLIFRPWK